MSSQVKVTNISHANGAGFGLWFAERFLKPGEFVFLPVEELPKNYHSLTNALEFDFVKEVAPSSSADLLLVQQMMEMQKTLLDQMGQMQAKLDDRPAQIQYVQVGPPGAERPPTVGIEAVHFIPDIEEAQGVDIQVASSSSKAVDKAALLAKLKKAKK